MNYKTNKRNFLYILCALICVISGSIFAVINHKQTVVGQQNCCEVSATDDFANEEDYAGLGLQNYNASASDSYFCLTDTNMMFIESQMTYGTCWIFSGTKALESYLQKTTGILYDFSESWISVCAKVEYNSMLLGGGGDFTRYYRLISKYGLLFEEEFPYEWLYNLDGSNYEEIFNNYKNKTNKTFTKNLDSNWFRSLSSEKVKQYLVNYGALSISYDASKVVSVAGKKYSCFGSSAFSSNHSITLIGWDDNLSFVDYDGKNHTGAYICFNSWGTTTGKDEVVYIAYDSEYVDWTIFGFKQKSTVNNFTFNISSSNAGVDNYEIGKYDYTKSNFDSGTYEDKNMFFYGDIIDVDFAYQYNNGVTDASLRAKITKNGEDVTQLFSKHFVNKKNKIFELETNKPIDSGRYFIEFDVDYNGDSKADENYITSITILSGAEMCYVNPSTTANELHTWQSFNKIQSVENPNYVYGYAFGNVSVAEFELSNYSTITNIEITDKFNMYIHSSNSLVPASSNSYSKKRIYLQVQLDSDRKAYEYAVNFKTIKGYKVTFKIVTYALEQYNDDKTFVFYNNNGGLFNSSLVGWIATGKNYNITLGEPTNTLGNSYHFTGWYVDKALTQQLTNLNSQVKKRDLSNYAEEQYKGNNKYVRKYIYVYAKWDRVPFYMEGANLGEKQYGDSVKFELDLAHNGSNNYNYSVDNSTLPLGTSLIKENDKYYIKGNLLVCGDFSFDFVCYDIDNDIEISATYTLTVLAREVTIKVNDKSSVFGEPLENLDWTVYSGTIYGNDDLNINLICAVAEDSPIGSYTIYGTCNNSNYDVTFINGTYKITNKRITFTLTGYQGVYDGQEHSVELDVSQNLAEVKVEYSLDGENYTSTPIFEKNFTNGDKIIYIKLSCENYETEKLITSINITKKNLTIVWTDGDYVYNGNEQTPSASTLDIIDDATISVNGGGTNAGNYTARASVNSDNYQITNGTKSYVIKKAKPVVEISSDDLSIDSQKIKVGDELGKIPLPAGYEWVDPTQKLIDGVNVYYARLIPNDLENYEIVDKIAMTISVEDKNLNPEVMKYAVVAICGGIILVILISIITTISRKAYERSCLNNAEAKNKNDKFDKDDQITIYFVTNSPITLPPMKSLKRISIDLPKLERNYYEFAGWYTDKLFINPYKNNGTEKIVTLYAKWLPKIYK